MQSLSVITPCFNEEENLEDCVLQVKEALQGLQFQHIFIDNSSTDQSVAVLQRLKKDFPHVRILTNSQNVGVFSSMQRALRVVNTEWVIPFFAADLQDPAEVIREMIELQKSSQCDSVFGVRASRVEKRWLLLLRRMFYKVLKMNSSGTYVSGTSEFCLIRSHVAQQLIQIEDPNPFLRIYLSQLRGNVKYVKFQMQERLKGKSSANLYSLVDDALNAFSIILPSIFSRLLVYALLGIGLGILIILFSVIDYFWLPIALENLFTVGVITIGFSFSVGMNSVIGHYVYIIHNQVRRKLTAATKELLD
jgi:glycosyltransferase involved in cell wall biosynthesis